MPDGAEGGTGAIRRNRITAHEKDLPLVSVREPNKHPRLTAAKA